MRSTEGRPSARGRSDGTSSPIHRDNQPARLLRHGRRCLRLRIRASAVQSIPTLSSASTGVIPGQISGPAAAAIGSALVDIGLGTGGWTPLAAASGCRRDRRSRVEHDRGPASAAAPDPRINAAMWFSEMVRWCPPCLGRTLFVGLCSHARRTAMTSWCFCPAVLLGDVRAVGPAERGRSTGQPPPFSRRTAFSIGVIATVAENCRPISHAAPNLDVAVAMLSGLMRAVSGLTGTR